MNSIVNTIPEIETLESLHLNHSSIGILLDTYSGVYSKLAAYPMLVRRVNALPLLYSTLSRKEFCGIFPKSCPGCIGLNLVCAAQLLRDTRLVCHVVGQLLNDPDCEIFTIEEMDVCRELTLRYYRRRDDPYPYMGNCLDFGFTNPFIDTMIKFGNLIQSSFFSSKMLTHRKECIEYVKAYITNSTTVTIDDFCQSL